MHVIVCGAGIVGLWCAHALRARGHEVTVLERHSADRDGCSFGNMGLLVPSHIWPLASPGAVARGLRSLFDSRGAFYVQPRLDAELLGWCMRFARAATATRAARAAPLLRDLHLASRAAYEQLARQTGNAFGLSSRGLLVLCRTGHGLEEEARAAARARALGVPAEVVSPARAAELDPGVDIDVVGAVFYPLDCHLDPVRLMAALLQRLQAAGVRFLWDSEVTGWRASQGRIEALLTARGELPADAFVLAAGVWSATLARRLQLRLPLQAGRGYAVTVANARQLPRLPFVLHEAHAAVSPVDGALRVGGTMELSGLSAPLRPERVHSLIATALRYFPALRAEDFSTAVSWSGLRPCSPDGLPYIGRLGSYRNLCVASGHAMMGVSLGPITGELVAQILADEPTRVPTSLLDPNRYG